MDYATPTVRQISNQFERHNPYANEAVRTIKDCPEDALIVYALLALAYELSQVRFHLKHLVKKGNFSNGRPEHTGPDDTPADRAAE